jgi:hypothetical protein
MNKETVALLVLPPIFMALAVAVHVALDPVSLTAIWVLVVLGFTTSLACLVRAISLLRGGRPQGYIFGAAAILYIVLLVIMCTPAKTKVAAQLHAPGDAGLRLSVFRCSAARRA